MFSQQIYWKFCTQAVLLLSIILALNVITGLADEDPLFGTADLEKRLSSRFKLSHKEMKTLRPLIRSDNKNVVLLYGNSSDDERSIYMSLWEKIRQSRYDFESSLDVRLNERERAALKMARTEFETRILNYWLEDYLEFLANVLELDNIQLSMVRVVFENERSRRHRLIVKAGTHLSKIESDWEQLARDREGELFRTLDSDQLRVYRSLSEWDMQMLA
jgi:hypothetical protein